MRKTDILSGELPLEKIKLDEQLFDKVMAMTLDSVNKEKVFKFGSCRISSVLSGDKFTVELNFVAPDDLGDEGVRIAKYIINRMGVIEKAINSLSIKEFKKEKQYKKATEALKDVLKGIKM